MSLYYFFRSSVGGLSGVILIISGKEGQKMKARWRARQQSSMTRHGFTLLECLWALFITACVLYGIQMQWRFMITSYHQQFSDRTTDFYQFSLLLEKELSQYAVQSIDSDAITMKDRETDKKYVIFYDKGRIYKSPGYHPYVFDVEDWELDFDDGVLWVTVTFNSGQTFQSSLILESSQSDA